MEGKHKEETIPFQNIVHTTLCLKCLDHHALTSACREASSPEAYLQKVKRLQQSRFVTCSDVDSARLSEHTFTPVSEEFFVIVTPSECCDQPYRVDPSNAAHGVRDDFGGDGEQTFFSFHDNGTELEHTDRHPGTTMDSDVEGDEDIKQKYPEYQANEMSSPITTTAAEHLYCIAFAGGGEPKSELRASYPLQLSARIDDSRKFLVFDCFEYKPKCFDADGDLTSHLPTNRAHKQWDDGFMMKQAEVDDEDSDSDDSWYDERVEAKEGKSFEDSYMAVLMYQGMAGSFAYSRCLRFRVPLATVIGIRLQADSSRRDVHGEIESDAGAVLILEVARRPDASAFAARKVSAKWFKENEFVLIKDWTPGKAASQSTRYYLYGAFAELRQTAALMGKVCPAIATMLASKSFKNNSLRDGISAAYAASPDFVDADSEKSEATGDSRSAKRPRVSRLQDYREAICSHCGEVYFRGNTGFRCPGCGGGKMKRNMEPPSITAFDGKLEYAVEAVKAQQKRVGGTAGD